jgi:hypothetical protein
MLDAKGKEAAFAHPLEGVAIAPSALRIGRDPRRFATRAQTFQGLRPSSRTAAVAVRSTTTHG